ncbi:hypothetical protein IMG5_009200 [Ichthyophthirius multifiliis]|uniref:Uncharacterized protein n=1 Tax=Ichthyophthirius multifiliis TaxID=5932 RepID=G0QJU6_ICHMU|nr:hypothetical protein IMG5_009200 [Ichthyophthirius multifiliis]EGR34511.1 hypothetical protein IMG5_009200 [Ichthyophthirius multifiliis]|eukprot:XP_004039815.1 hypothetical protein IMG5_009200 [Ichthyophthirius multifiliis]
MPPKKKDEEINTQDLPPWISLKVILKYQGKKSRYQNLIQNLKINPKQFQKSIFVEEILEFAKEKGLYVNPNSLNEKQKKDPKQIESLNTQITPQLLAQSFNQLIQDLDIKGRLAKKKHLKGKKKNLIQKRVKEAKKDNKKVAKNDIVEDEIKKEEVKNEIEYQKVLDIIYFLSDFPKLEEIQFIEQEINIVFYIKESYQHNNEDFNNTLLNQKNNFEEDLKERMNDFIENNNNQNGIFLKKIQIILQKKKENKKNIPQYDEEDIIFILENQKYIEEFKKQCKKNQHMKNSFVRNLNFPINIKKEDESLQNFTEKLIQNIFQFSIDLCEYQIWLQSKPLQKLCPKEYQETIKKQQEEEDLRLKVLKEQQEKASKVELESKNKKGAQKETKKDTKKVDEPKQIKEEKKIETIEKPPEIIQKLQEPFFQYFNQLNEIDLQNTTTGIILECVLDNIEQKDGVQKINGQNQIQDIINDIQSFINLQNENQIQNYKKKIQLTEKDKNFPSKTIIDENDLIENKSFNLHLNNFDIISIREKSLFKNILLPGVNRFQMPQQPTKNEPQRKAEKTQLYSFITSDVIEFERRQSIFFFEKIAKEIEANRDWDFSDRIYMEKYDSNNLSQVLYQSLLYEPFVYTKYNEEYDNLYIIIYFKNPPGRILRKKWRTEWRVIPNIENWINNFKSNPKNMQNNFFYDIDSEKIGNIYESIKYMYPNDNSVILGDKYQVGNNMYYRYKIIKENVVFGINETNEGQAQFWAYFENNSQLLIELENLTKKKNQDYSLVSTMNQLNEDQKQEQKQEEVKEDLQSQISITLPNGLLLKFLPNGDVIQTKLDTEKKHSYKDFEDIVTPHEENIKNTETEVKRMITGKGSVIKYMKDGSTIILYANGNTSFSQQKNGIWITTNNKGFRKVKNNKDNTEIPFQKLNIQEKIDPELCCKIIIREDQTLIITYKDGTKYVKHQDGTEIITSPKGEQIIVEHPQFATVKVLFDEVTARADTVIGMGSSYANVGYQNLFERSNDGRVIETYIQDGTKVVGYTEKQELPGYNQWIKNFIYLIYMQDGSICKVLDNSEIVFISAVDRASLRKNSENDIQYWLQLFCIREERKGGVYSGNLIQKCIWTKDDEGNFFEIKSNGEISTKIAVSLNLNQDQFQGIPFVRPSTPEFQQEEYIEEENKFLPQPPTWIPVKLFVVQNDNTGYQLLNDEQLNNYIKLKNENKNCVKIEEKINSTQNCTSISYITQILSIEEQKIKFINPIIPKILNTIPSTLKQQTEVQKKAYKVRNLLKFQNFNQHLRQQYQKDLDNYNQWKIKQQQLKQSLKVIQKTEEQKDAEYHIQLKIQQKLNQNQQILQNSNK